jgi:DNA-damage-inducible protein J
MSANSIVRARIDEKIKNEAADVLRAMGLTVSDAFRMMMVKIAKEKALPFEPLVPNEETIEAMKAARRGERDRRPAGEAALKPECGLLNTPAGSSATTSGRNWDGTASGSTPS